MDIESIKALIASFSPSKLVYSGVRENSKGDSVQFQLLHGWDIELANKCDREWTAKNIEILTSIREAAENEEDLLKKVSTLNMEDAHWRWTKKAINLSSQEYNWFFYRAENSVQGACLIYHPKNSVIDEEGIFYIEYVAVAPWNRPNPLEPARFKGVGSELIRYASSFATESLGLRPGFSLHSLPKAAPYYRKIGMTCYPEKSKDSLDYFEMAREAAQKFGAAAHG